jgi:hypothetical protein
MTLNEREESILMRDSMRQCLFVAMACLAATTANAHHAASIHYDMSDTAEIEGRVTSVEWANPHSVITIQGAEAGGAEAEWRIEAAAAAMILRSGISRDTVAVGDTVRAAGFRGRKNTNAMFLRNFLLADGREWLSQRSIEPIWTSNIVGAEPSVTASAADNRRDIFKVWSLDEETVPRTGPPRPLWNDSYPLTEMAKQSQQRWAQGVENPYVNCRNGMPAIMDTPIPMEFGQEGGNIVLRFEELDARRVFLMGEAARSTPVISGPYGHSTGRWEGETLVVHTSGIDWAWFDQDGIPLTSDVEITERFTASTDGRYLDYVATVVDEDVFSEPVTLDRRWAWIPSERVQSYDCEWDETSL